MVDVLGFIQRKYGGGPLNHNVFFRNKMSFQLVHEYHSMIRELGLIKQHTKQFVSCTTSYNGVGILRKSSCLDLTSTFFSIRLIEDNILIRHLRFSRLQETQKPLPLTTCFHV